MSRQTPWCWPMRSRTPRVRKPADWCRAMLARFSGKIEVCRVHSPRGVGGGDLAVEEGLADAAAAVAVADVDARSRRPRRRRAGARPGWRRPSRRPRPSSLGDPAVVGQPRVVEGAPVGDLGLEGGVAGGDAFGVDAGARPASPLGPAPATVTSAGRSSGQQGRGPSMPMTTSAACGRPVQQAALTETMVAVFDLVGATTNPTSASLRTWWEQVDWLMPSCSASSPTRHRAARRVATACSSRTRVGSARHGEPLRVGRRVVLATAGTDAVVGQHGQGQVHAHAAQYRRHIDGCVNRRTSIQSPSRSIEDRRWRPR